MNHDTDLRAYLRDVEHTLRAGNATEHSYRPALKTLLQRLAPSVTAVNEPKHVECGAPDFAITRTASSGPRTVGYIETKDVGVSLDETERTPQLRRYRDALENLLLTDYLEFRWYVGGGARASARLASRGPGHTLVWDAPGAARVASMLVEMMSRNAPDITSPDDLAQRMARLAHMIRDVALDTFRSEGRPGGEMVRGAREELRDLYETVKDTLIPDLTDAAFADMFAQTLAYGLFAARCNHTGPQPFTRRDAAHEIPRSNPFLRRLFAAIESRDLDDAPYVGFVDDLAQLLAATDMDTILRDFGQRAGADDPITHFYEPFLQAYNPQLREMRGVYYTPAPVVSYIVRSVDTLLTREFDLPAGLASGGGPEGASAVVLDPACGTGTFLASVINLIRDRFHASNNAGAWAGYVRERLLPRVFGFELLMAPYAMAHLRLGMQLAGLDVPESTRAQWTFQAGEGERLGVYLTNTLDQTAKQTEHLFGGQFITMEANSATRIKRDASVMVVLGNPPYSGHSANNGDWIMALLRGEDLTNTQGDKPLDRGKGRPTENYFMVDGAPLGERNPKWLNDDYVKFIRFAQWRIERSGYGVLAFITNHGYLDNPTFRGMRQSLMRTFDDIYVLDLHGNAKKKERTPAGGKDENVFDIQQGVAIGIFVRRRGAATGDRHARVYHANLWGERAGKYNWLAERDITSTEWTEVTPQTPSYLFASRDVDLAAEYEASWKLSDVATVSSAGIVTARDDLTIHITADEVWRTVTDFVRREPEDARAYYNLGPDARDWQVVMAQADVKKSGPTENKITGILYRPFDIRQTYYTGVTRGFQCMPRPEVMRHILSGPNIGLITTRQTRDDWDALATNHIIGHKALAAYDINSLFPLYLYPDSAKPGLWGVEEASSAPGGRRPNLSPEFVRDFSARLGIVWVPDGKGDRQATFGPEDVFSYIYAILHAPSYRERYADFLKSDFPRVPLTRDADLFRELCAMGDRLVALHLMEASAPSQPSFPVGGDSRVEAVRYQEPDAAQGRAGRVYINAGQYFDGVAPDVWDFHIGGYQVAEKWLKDRKGRTLTYSGIEHYQRTIAALAETARLMEQIDATIEDRGGWPLGAADTSANAQ